MAALAAAAAPPPPALAYLPGFANEHSTEALPGALPQGQNSPQRCPYGLYAEQLSGTAFTAPRHQNRRSWLYRVRPSAAHGGPLVPCANAAVVGSFSPEGGASALTPNPLRWLPPPLPPAAGAPVDWLSGLFTMAGAGAAEARAGLAIHMYAFTAGMGSTVFANADGEMLLVPQAGGLRLRTEFGVLEVAPQEIAVVPRGVKFSVGPPLGVPEGAGGRGYVLEVFAGHFELPELGPLGSNGLANARDFLYPCAAYEDLKAEHTLVTKFGGAMHTALLAHSPFDVVAWHGSYAPYKYDLRRFNTMNTVSFDHPDPSIFTVLTVPSHAAPGTALADFVIFPPRWLVAEGTFRPPWFHRNCMTEFMGMVYGSYDAKVAFQPGGASLHAVMTPHGPDADTVRAATAAALEPRKTPPGLAFMFETCHMLRVCRSALEAPWRDVEYQKCWSGCVGGRGRGALGGRGKRPPSHPLTGARNPFYQHLPSRRSIPKTFDPSTQ